MDKTKKQQTWIYPHILEQRIFFPKVWQNVTWRSVYMTLLSKGLWHKFLKIFHTTEYFCLISSTFFNEEFTNALSKK